jgi:hypothetical protein
MFLLRHRDRDYLTGQADMSDQPCRRQEVSNDNYPPSSCHLTYMPLLDRAQRCMSLSFSGAQSDLGPKALLSDLSKM